ncbi:DMT family transporter [Falsiroseomonas oryziterrae]|uniref:DMT family transporter n=1 Tax=Falsiroseomonas oryziterrae TaxID=2911368 RepID=UPI001F1A85DF|nr:DMT family transporter [Roseomonas sp. NPKOSM-4]
MSDTAARDRRIGYACAFAVLFVWSGFLVFSRLAQAQAFTPWDVAALRYAGSFVAALPLVAIFGLPRLPPHRVAAIVATAAFGFPILAYLGFRFAPAAHGGVLMPGLLPFVTAALFWIVLREGWTRRRALSLAVVACGIALLASDTFGDYPGAWRGDLLFLTAGCCWAVYTLLVRLWRVPAMQATLVIALVPAPIFLPLWWLALPSNIGAVPLGAVAFHFVYQGALATVLAGFLFTRAVTAIGAARTTAVTALVPAMAALAAWPLLGEALGVVGLAGVALVSAGMILGVTGAR